jgi:1,4-dihydroxy-2-naphthoate octaprenyltransferase
LLAFFGLLFSHIAVNVLNDYFDYKSGIDLATPRTPFSGGSGILPAALMKPRQAFWLGMVALLLALAIGIYFMVAVSWLLLPIIVVAAICILLYSPFILKMKWPEWSPGLGLGILPVLGTYFVQSANYAVPAIIASIPSGFMVHNLLLLNEFPDVEADKKGGRKTMPITLGKKGASRVYSALNIAVYVWIIGAVAARQMPIWTLLALLTLPFAIKAIRGALKYDDMSKLMPGMGNNVLFILFTHVLMGVGYILARVL